VWLIIILMVLQMTEARIRTVQQAREVSAGTYTLEFKISDEDGQCYAWTGSVLRRFGYTRLNRADRGVVLAYLRHLRGHSRAQVTRLRTSLEGCNRPTIPWCNDHVKEVFAKLAEKFIQTRRTSKKFRKSIALSGTIVTLQLLNGEKQQQISINL